MASQRTISNLTEAWPEDAENFELQAFAAAVRDGRPELSAPAIDRIGDTLFAELDRQTALPERLPTRRQQFRTHSWSLVRMSMPYAAAACVMVACGIWAMQKFSQGRSPSGLPRNSQQVTEQRPQTDPRDTPPPHRVNPEG